MRTQLYHRFSMLVLLLVLSLGMVACGGGGSGSNTAPVVSDASISVMPGGTTTGTLVARDADYNAVTFSIVSNPSDGTVRLDNRFTGAYTYTNTGNQNYDSFTFKANDGGRDSNIATVSITNLAPDVPSSGLAATPGDQSNKLDWDAVTWADSYKVYRSLVSGTGASGSEIATVAKPPFYDNSALTNGTTYYYVVTAANNAGESAASTELSATPENILIGSLVFADSSLQYCVDKAASDNAWTYVHDVTALNCSGRDLSGIEALTSLTHLELDSAHDVSPLAGLTRLTYLNLSFNYVHDVGPLAGLTNLETLDLWLNNIGYNVDGHVDMLAGLVKAKYINLDGNYYMSCNQLSSLISALGSPPVSPSEAISAIPRPPVTPSMLYPTSDGTCVNP